MKSPQTAVHPLQTGLSNITSEERYVRGGVGTQEGDATKINTDNYLMRPRAPVLSDVLQ